MRAERRTSILAIGGLLVTVAIIVCSAVFFPLRETIRVVEIIAEGLITLSAFAIAQLASGLSQKKTVTVIMVVGAELFYFGSLQDLLEKIFRGTALLGAIEDSATFIGILLLCFGLFLFVRNQRLLFKELEASKNRLSELSITDALTGLYNSRHFYDRMAAEILRANRYGRTFSILLFDIDDFKKHNDEFGHVSGDKVLKQLGETVRMILREQDSGYRYGGEEFTVLLPETDEIRAIAVAERLRQRVTKERFDKDVVMTISIGVSEYQAGEEASLLVKRADEAMYRAKRSGKNRVERC